MASFDLSDLLSTSLNTLHLQHEDPIEPSNNTNPQELTEFHLFPELPIELRIKIFEDALPKHQTLQVFADILLADPDFGLYLTFSIIPPSHAPEAWTLGTHTIVEPKGWYHSTRTHDLLSVNKECRNIYLENFPCTLPSGPQKRGYEGKIRFSPKEAIHISNFDQLIKEWDVYRAINEGWRFQRNFSEIERLIVPVEWFLVENAGAETRAKMLRRFTGLKVAWAKMWVRFGEETTEEAAEQVRLGMNNSLGAVEERLKLWKEDEDESYVVPRIKLMD